MSRPKKAVVDYFPHYANPGKTVTVIQHLFGNDGYAFFYKLMGVLAQSDGHFYDCRLVTDQEYLASETHVQWDLGSRILDQLAKMDVIDRDLWQIGVIWMKSLVDSIRDAYKKRTVSVPEKPDRAGFLPPEIPSTSGISGAGNPQSKVNKIIPPLTPPDNPPPKKPKKVKVVVDYDSEIKKALDAFPIQLQTPVQAFVAAVASLNKTQAISQSRELSLLCELGDVLTTATPDIFRYAILEGTNRKVGSVAYLKAIIKRKAEESLLPPVNGHDPPRGEPLPSQPYYRENRDRTWTRVDPDGSETVITREEMESQRVAQAAMNDDNPVMDLVHAMTASMGSA